MHQVRETSKRAYWNFAIGSEPTQYEAILDAMKPEIRYTRRELHNLTGIETSTISARVNSLLKRGKIMRSGYKKCPFTNVEVDALVKVEAKPVTLRLI